MNLYNDDFINLIKKSNDTYLIDLLNQSKQNDTGILSKKNKKSIIKNAKIILSECEKKKKKEIKNTGNVLAKLAKYCTVNSLTEVKKVNTDLEDKIYNIDLIINHINNKLEDPENYIECYKN